MDEPPDDGPTGDDGSVLSPNELDISDDESVVQIDDGRYVISPGGGNPSVPPDANPAVPSDDDGDDDESDGDADPEAIDLDVVHEWLGSYLTAADSKYAFDVTASFQGREAQKALFSNDVVTTFENLVVWYAHHAGGETPVEDVIGILLMESNVSVRYPADSVLAFAEANDLRAEDPIEDLLEAADEAGGIQFPPDEG